MTVQEHERDPRSTDGDTTPAGGERPGAARRAHGGSPAPSGVAARACPPAAWPRGPAASTGGYSGA
jgi:hypothetical protein